MCVCVARTKALVMKRIAGALTVLTWMVALSVLRAEDVTVPVLDPLVPQPPASFTPEQHEIASEVLDALGWVTWLTLQEFGVVDHFEDRPDVENAEAILDASLDEFREMLKPNLVFLRRVCDLSDSEFQIISQSADARLREITQQLFEEQNSESDDPTSDSDVKTLTERIQEAIAQVAECQLTAEQWERYSDELRKRSEHRKRVAILNLVARLDADLLLSSSQRDQFAKLLEARWNAAWGQSLGLLTDDSNFMPELPQEEVDRILSPTQRVAMAALQYEHEAGLWGDGAADWVFAVEEEVLVEEGSPSEDSPPQNAVTPEARP